MDQVEGMKPDKKKHEMYMILEPVYKDFNLLKLFNHNFNYFFQHTSMPLEVAGRFQINILVEPIQRIKMYRNVPTKILPIVWVEQSFKINNQMAFIIKLILWTPCIGQIIGFIIVAVSIYMIYKTIRAEEKERIRAIEKEKIKEKLKMAELSPLVNGNNNNNKE